MTSQCCGNLKGRMVHEKGNLARLARNASHRQAKGLLVTAEALKEIKAAKRSIAELESIIEDHEAEHAGEVEVA